MKDNLLQIKNVDKHFSMKSSFIKGTSEVVHAVDGISISMNKGDILGLVGESGCGKTTTGRMVVRLEDPTRGTINYNGRDISQIKGPELKLYRREVQMVFQDPFESLNPRRTVQSILSQPYLNHNIAKGSELKSIIIELLDTVGLKPGAMYLGRYPHQFSGGQRQRIGIARAIALHPKLVVADEPVSALDISIRGQILSLMVELQEKIGLSYLFISHDLSVVRSLCNNVAVMYMGKIVETGTNEDLFSTPVHPYTKALLSATPLPDPVVARSKKRIILQGDLPSAIHPPSGCRFRTRCPYQKPICTEEEPSLQEHLSGHTAACHRVKDIPV
jgi:oligopeptide/dipeptide ABC transporter ATP-binding protein